MTGNVIGALASRLALTGPLVFLDTETTGLSAETDRVVEVAILELRPDGSMDRARSYVNPGAPIPSAATAIHKITDAIVAKAPTFKTLAPRLLARIQGAQAVAGYNAAFDLRMLAAEFRRAGLTFDPESVTVVDPMRIFHAKEPRDLTGAARFYCDREHEDAHGAAPDVEITAIVLAAQLARYEDAPRTVEQLERWTRDPEALDREGKIVWSDGAARLAFGKHAGKALVDVDPGFLRWMLANDFGTSTKAIVADALRGVYSVGPVALGEGAP